MAGVEIGSRPPGWGWGKHYNWSSLLRSVYVVVHLPLWWGLRRTLQLARVVGRLPLVTPILPEHDPHIVGCRWCAWRHPPSGIVLMTGVLVTCAIIALIATRLVVWVAGGSVVDG